MGLRSRQKGKVGEREARDAARKHLGATEVVRAAQVNGAFSADLIGLHPNLHVEVKRIKRIPATDFMLQAEQDAKPKQVPIVLFREDGGGVDDWILMVRLKNAKALSEVLKQIG